LRIVAVVPLDVQFPLDGEELLEKLRDVDPPLSQFLRRLEKQ
jgi:hypothetical protein